MTPPIQQITAADSLHQMNSSRSGQFWVSQRQGSVRRIHRVTTILILTNQKPWLQTFGNIRNWFGTTLCRWLAATDAQLDGSVDPNRDLLLNQVKGSNRAELVKRKKKPARSSELCSKWCLKKPTNLESRPMNQLVDTLFRSRTSNSVQPQLSFCWCLNKQWRILAWIYYIRCTDLHL